MSIGSGSQSNSQYLSSSTSSLHRTKKASSEISKTYKHASQLYLTRRLAECYDILQPVIKPQAKQEERNGNHSQSEDDASTKAPIATATTSQRIKIWSLYVTLLNSVVELGDEEGKRDFGSKLYRELVRSVQSGEIWEQVVQDGYMGREASVDAEVVYNLSNLLLAQAPDQKTNQSRLETYLSSSPGGLIDFSTAFQNGSRHHNNGTDTPKDLNSRIKILELFTLHVLPRNDEWDYARSFVANSDILDEERREAFLQTLTELQEAKEQEAAEQDLVGFEDDEEDVFEESEERIQMNETQSPTSQSNDATSQTERSLENRAPFHRRTSSEVDYGIDDDDMQRAGDRINSPRPATPIQRKSSSNNNDDTATIETPQQPMRTTSPRPLLSPPPIKSQLQPQSKPVPPRQTTLSPPPQQVSTSQAPRSLRPQRKTAATSKASGTNTANSASNNNSSSSNLVRQTQKMLLMIRNLASTLSASLTKNPTSIFRTLLFLFAFLMVLSRREIRDRVKRVVSSGWDKVRRTAGLGVKVSYI